MSFSDWKDKINGFEMTDLRGSQGNFFNTVKELAEKLPAGRGFEIVQAFDPLPLYAVMEKLGFEHHTEKTGDAEFHVYFYRSEGGAIEEEKLPGGGELSSISMINEDMGKTASEFGARIYGGEGHALSYETRLLISLANAVGAGRMRQAEEELVKAYKSGTDAAAFDDVFEIIAWNQGIGSFDAEIGNTGLFAAYKTIKNMEKQGKSREEIISVLEEKYS